MTELIDESLIQIEELDHMIEDETKPKTQPRRTYRTNVYKKIYSLISHYTEQVDNSHSLVEIEQKEKLLSLLLKIRAWLEEGEYLNEKARELIQLYLENNFSVKAVAKAFDISNNAVHKAISRANSEAEKYITRELIEVIEEGKYDESLYYFEYKTSNPIALGLLGTDVVKRIEHKEVTEQFALASCEYELKLLKMYAIPTLEKNLLKGDRRKFEYLIKVLLGNQTIHDYERYLLTNFLKENLLGNTGTPLTFNEFMDMVKEKNL